MRFFFPCVWSFFWISSFILNLSASERVAFDSGGKLSRLIDQGDSIAVEGCFRVRLKDGTEHLLQGLFPMRNESLNKDRAPQAWDGYQEVSEKTKITFETIWNQEEGEVVLKAVLAAEEREEVESVAYLVDVDREVFMGGKIRLGASEKILKDKRFERGLVSEGSANMVIFESQGGQRRLEVRWEDTALIRITDIWNEFWEKDIRRYRIEIPLLEVDRPDERSGWHVHVKFKYKGSSTRSVTQVQVGSPLENGLFEGFGGNFCFNSSDVVSRYLRDALPLGWSRHEMKLQQWDEATNGDPGAALVDDFEQIQVIAERGIPWIISIWRLPERFYQDPFERSPKANQRKINPETWNELLELIGGYLHHLKNDYGVEPDLISFNEPNLGIGVLLSPDEHLDAVRRIGRYLKARGFETQMLLGDVTGPIDTYRYLLPTIKDAEAMQYAGGIAFHGWGGASPEEYAMWGSMKRWLGLPLFVSEAGTDPFAWRSGIGKTHFYGVGEVREFLKSLHFAQPTSIQYWQYTAGGYSLVNVTETGEIEPTSRYWMVKQLSDLTLAGSIFWSVNSSDDEIEPAVLSKGDYQVVHLLNGGPRRRVELTGLSPGKWKWMITNETEGMKESGSASVSSAGTLSVDVDELSLTTLVLESPL